MAGYRCTISVSPSLDAGCAGGGGGSMYATRSNPLFGGVGIGITDPPVRGDTVGYVMTSPAVVEVRVGDRAIRTFSSPDLPAGDRAAVWFIPDGGPTPVIGCRPGEPIRAQITFPAFVHHRPVTIHTIAVLPIDAHGAVIATNPPAFGGPAPSTLAGRAARSEGSPDRNPSLGIRIPSTRRPPA